MNTDTIVIVLLLLLTVFVIVAVLAYIVLLKYKAKNTLKVETGYKKDFLYMFYLKAQRFTPLKRYMQRIRKRIEILNLSDDWTISRKTMRFTLISLGVTFSLMTVLLLFSRNLYSLCISLLTTLIIHNQLIKLMVDRMDNALLRQFEGFLSNVRHHYHEHGMVDEAIYDSIGECDYEISLHANRLYEILTATDVEDSVAQYNDNAPNKFMKTFIAMCFLVQRFGDKRTDNKSVFLNNLNYLKQEINIELLKREKLGYLFQGLSAIAVFPIFTLQPLENWAVSNIPELTEYYNGAYGFVIVIILFGLVLLAYQLIGRLQTNVQYSPLNDQLMEIILKIPLLKALTDGIIERNYTKALNYDRVLKKTGVKISVNAFIAKKIFYAVITLIISIGVFTNIHIIVRHNLLYSSRNLQMAEFDDRIDYAGELRIIESDRKYIRLFKGRKATYSQIKEALHKEGEYTDSAQSDIAAARILDKLHLYNRHTFKWWEMLISIALAIIAFYLPWWMLLFRERVQMMNMEDEVMQFHTIILMLIHIERIQVEDILVWLEQFADIFKSSISKCINDYENGDRQALEQLAVDEPYAPFVRIVENLQSAADKITIRHAFDGLKTEREYYQEKRKQDNEILVNKKGMWGKFIAFIPFGATVFLYLLLPFILISAAQLNEFADEFAKVF